MKKIQKFPQQAKQKAQKATYKIEPLPATVTLTGMLGLIITTVFTASGRISLSWGVAFDLVFALMFIASIISISPRSVD